MDGNKYPPQSYKVEVTQKFEVYLYFQEGILADDDNELYDIVVEEAINAAFGEDGLTAVMHEQTESSNGYIAHVETIEPTADIQYNYKSIPAIIKQELQKKGFTHDG